MYEQLFRFDRRPFCSVPAAEQYFPASGIDAALESTRMCVERATGPAVVFGGAGMGKTLLLNVLQQEFAKQFRAVHVVACNRMSRRHDLLQNILFELGQPYRDMSEGELRLALIDYLRPSSQCPRGILLLIDDAHGLPARLLDELRLITNFVRDGQPRARLVLAGLPSLEERLGVPKLESLNQRIAARCYLKPLRRDELEAYVRHHVVRAGRPEQDLFPASAIAAIAKLCEGNPRLINQVCDHALILAASSGMAATNGEVIGEAFADLQQLPANLWRDAGEPITGQSSSAGPQPSIVEFGSLGSEVGSESAKDGPTDVVEDDATEIPEAVGKSLDQLASLVDELTEFEEEDVLCEHHISPEHETQSIADARKRELAADPFDDDFGEEFEVVDHYAQLAARHNAMAAQTAEDALLDVEWPAGSGILDASVDESEPTPVAFAAQPKSLSAANDDHSPSKASEQGLERQTASDNSRAWFTIDDIELAHIDDGSIPYPITLHEPYGASCEEAIGIDARPVSVHGGDDRDLLFVSQGKRRERAPIQPPHADAPVIGRGQAVRVEYGRLFQQLRGSEPRT
jgi:type II secretory pathway predicted ATPase ExeA